MTFFLIFIGCSGRYQCRKVLSSQGEVLKEYEQGKDYYMVVKEGNKINKWRIYDWSGGFMTAGGTNAEYVYIVDQTTQTCFTGSKGQTPIECNNVKRDPDMAPYITW